MARAGLHLTVACVACGTMYRQARSDQMYCTNLCGMKDWRKKNANHYQRTAECMECGRPFEALNDLHHYCSELCRTESDAKRRKERRSGGPGSRWAAGKQFVPRTICVICGAEFYAPPIQKRRGGGRFCSVRCRAKEMSEHPERYPQLKSRRGIGGKREDLGGMYFRSSWEANWARYLNWLKSIGEIVSWEYECETFEFHKIKRGSRFYTPDFKVINKDGTIERHEVKGYMDQRSQTKLNRMAKYYPEIKLILIDKKYYRAVADKVSKLIPNWETVRGKAFRAD
jgi:hypothetical protein